MIHAPVRSRVVVCSRESDRLCLLLEHLGFLAQRIGPDMVAIEDSSVDDVRRVALLFQICALLRIQNSDSG